MKLVINNRITEQTADHDGKDKYLNLFKHTCNGNYKHFHLDKIKVFDFGYHNNKYKQYKPTLNTQEQSIPLKIFH